MFETTTTQQPTLSKKLADIINTINHATTELQKSETLTDSQKLIHYASIISNGEKKLKSQYLRKTAQRNTLNHELEIIKTLAVKLNYNLEWS